MKLKITIGIGRHAKTFTTVKAARKHAEKATKIGKPLTVKAA